MKKPQKRKNMQHWWLDSKTDCQPLQNADWDFRPLWNDKESWQLRWAWEYECWREWQPRSDFQLWRIEWRKNIKLLLSPSQDWIRGRLTNTEAEQIACSQVSSLPLWLLRDFSDCFPEIPWTKIPIEKRQTLKLAKRGKPLSLESSFLALKEPHPNTKGFPLIPEKLRVQHPGYHSLRQPDPQNAEEMTLYAEYRAKIADVVHRGQGWLEAPGFCCNKMIHKIAPGVFAGVYVIRIPWHRIDDDINTAFAAWLQKKSRELKGRIKFKLTGRMKSFEPLNQLGALRLLRTGRTAPEAEVHTKEVRGDTPLYRGKESWSRAKRKADSLLTAFFGTD